MTEEFKLISVNDLKVGMFIKLELSWFEHSFPMNSFKISNSQQLSELKALKLTQVKYYPERSDLNEEPSITQSGSEQNDNELDVSNQQAALNHQLMDEKRRRAELFQKQRKEIRRCEERFLRAGQVVKNLNKQIFSRPKESLDEAHELINSVAETFLSKQDVVMHLMQQSGQSEEVYFHTLNVSVLSMMLASEMNLDATLIRTVGMGGLFHDLGKANIPTNVVNKIEPLTKPEQNLLEMHAQYGFDLAQKLGLSKEVANIILQHHEFMDGTGYPNKLKSEQIETTSRIVSIANVYDNLCNHVDPRLSVTPHEALSSMYAHRRVQFDSTIMATLIKCLGVYPPGTLVKLSNEAVGLVMNVNVGQPLRPRILIYESEVRKEDAIIVDLAHEKYDLNIRSSIRPSLLPKPIFEYLSPRKRISYYIDTPGVIADATGH